MDPNHLRPKAKGPGERVPRAKATDHCAPDTVGALLSHLSRLRRPMGSPAGQVGLGKMERAGSPVRIGGLQQPPSTLSRVKTVTSRRGRRSCLDAVPDRAL